MDGNLLSGILIGFSLGLLSAIAVAGATRGLYRYWQFKARDCLVNLQEADRMIAAGAKVFLIRDQALFRTLLLPADAGDHREMTPHAIFHNGVMLDKFNASRRFWHSRSPQVEVEDLPTMYFD